MGKSFDKSSYSSKKSSNGKARSASHKGSHSRSSSSSHTAKQASSAYQTQHISSAYPSSTASSYDASYDGAAGNTASSNPYSRAAISSDNYTKRRKSKKHRKVLVAMVAVLAVVLAGGAGAAYAYLSNIQANMQADVSDDLLNALEETEASDPFYMVLLGTDSSEAREESGSTTFRTDSIMLVRVDPQQKTVTLVSLLRDTMVDMGEYGTQKLNAAYAYGGASYAVEVISEMAGVPISHYAEVDFDGFAEIVDAVGGIEVDVPVEIDDDEAGGHLDAGLQTLNGEQALILCRSRHTYDNVGTGKGDEYRAANQRMVIGAIVEKVLDSDLVTMIGTVQALSEYITTDFSVQDILSLAFSMSDISMDSGFYTATNPTVSEYIDGVWWEVMDEDAWEEMMSRIDQGLSPTEESNVDEETGIVLSSGSNSTLRSGTVSIRNGTAIDGAAAAAQTTIDELGYTTDIGDADSTTYTQTIIVYNDEPDAEYAQEIADVLGIGTIVLNQNEYVFSTDYLVVIGADWVA